MTHHLPLLSADELDQAGPGGARAGFGALETAKGPLPLKAQDVEARIDGLVVRLDVHQTFVNTVGEPLEATYIFPLPDRAAVTGFQMRVADRVIDGILKERGEARREYEAAIEQGRRAAIAEEERSNIFTLCVGNILPGETASVRLSLVAPLSTRDGEAELRFPFVVAPRYIPGLALDGEPVGDGAAADTDLVPDASRISPPVLLPGLEGLEKLLEAFEQRAQSGAPGSV